MHARSAAQQCTKQAANARLVHTCAGEAPFRGQLARMPVALLQQTSDPLQNNHMYLHIYHVSRVLLTSANDALTSKATSCHSELACVSFDDQKCFKRLTVP